MTHTAFTPEQYEAIYPSGIEHHYWNHCRNRIIYDVLKRYSLHTKNVFEIGCGRGIVTAYLARHRVCIEGYEVASVPVEEIIRPFVHTGIDALQLPEEKRKMAEVILLADVIEHIEDPRTFLEDILHAFPRAAHILITVPACREIWSNYDEFNGHFRRYEMDDLFELATSLQMEVKRIQYMFHALWIPARILAKMKKERNVFLTPPRGITKIFHRLLSFYFYLEYKIFPGDLKGTSLMLYMRRKNNAFKN